MKAQQRSKSLSRMMKVIQGDEGYKLSGKLNGRCFLLNLTRSDYYQMHYYGTFCWICAELNIDANQFSDKAFNTAFEKFKKSVREIAFNTVVSFNIKFVNIEVHFNGAKGATK